jgi:cytoskeletal protein CcmA (bactofilin family)
MFPEKKIPESAARTNPVAPSSQRSGRTSAPSILGSDLMVSGTITSNGEVHIDGRVEGEVRIASLVIGERALIRGDIISMDVTIRGRVEGNILACKVHLASTSHVEGDIHQQSMAVESGAFFEGRSRHSDDPLSSVSAPKKTASNPRPFAAADELAH